MALVLISMSSNSSGETGFVDPGVGQGPSARQVSLALLAENIVGEWEFSSVLIDGVERPPFNPKLHLHFLFRANQFDRLWWWRDDEAGFCDRWGRYTFDGKTVTDEVVWVNPGNESSCQMDPDMRPGRVAQIPIRFIDQRMVIDFDVNGKAVGYVWSRVGGDLRQSFVPRSLRRGINSLQMSPIGKWIDIGVAAGNRLRPIRTDD